MNYVEPPDIPEGMTMREWRIATLTTDDEQIGALARVRRWVGSPTGTPRRQTVRTAQRDPGAVGDERGAA